MGSLQAYAKDSNSTVKNGKNQQTEPHEIKKLYSQRKQSAD